MPSRRKEARGAAVGLFSYGAASPLSAASEGASMQHPSGPMTVNFVSDDAAEARVYVNNMNTPYPVVGLPARGGNGPPGRLAALQTSRGRGAVGDDAFVGGDTTASSARAASTVRYADHTTGKVTTTVHNAASRPRAQVSHVGDPRSTANPAPLPMDSLSSAAQMVEADLHPNLEAVYARVMRKLQRELNYEELQRVSLLEQYGVTPDDVNGVGDEEDDGAVHAMGGEGTSRASLTATKSSAGDGTAASGNQHEAATRTGSIANSASASRITTAAAAAAEPSTSTGTVSPGHHHTSMIVRYGRRQNTDRLAPPAARANDSVAHGADATAQDEAEQSLAMQPCPRTLRLVVQHVQQTLQNKMSLAERGSVKDCLRLAFESRALLDRLLKEAPTYAAFPDDPDGLPAARARIATGGRGSTVSPHRLQEMYQEFRRRPVLLPRAVFVQDESTGAVAAELDFAQEAALGLAPRHSIAISTGSVPGGYGTAEEAPAPGPARASTALPPAPTTGRKTLLGRLSSVAQEVLQAGAAAGHAPSSSMALPAGGNGAAGEEVVLPASYGQSTRKRRGALSEEAAAAAAAGSQQGRGTLGDGLVRAPSHQSDATDEEMEEDRLGLPHTSVRPPSASSRTRSQEASSGTVRSLSPPRAGTERRNTTHRGLPSAVRTVSVGTVTEENATNTVTQDMYDALRAHAEDLQVQLAEARSTHANLAEKLLEEENYVDSRRRILTHLRETLVRECNMLRSQLNFAAHREQQLQLALREKQQQEHMGGGEGPGAAASRSAVAGGNAGGLGSAAAARSRLGYGGPRQSAAALSVSGANMNGAATPRHSVSIAGAASANVESSCSHVSAGVGSPTYGPFGSPMTRSSQGQAWPPQSPGGHRGTEQGGFSSDSGAGHGHPTPYHPSTTAAAAAAGTTSDITSIQSLLDLVLLAVENDEVFPGGLAAIRDLPPDAARPATHKDLKHQADALRASFEEKSKRLQDSIMTQKIRNNYTVMEKDKEIARLEKLTDLSYVEQSLRERVRQLRNEQRKLRNQIHESLQGFQVMMNATITSVLNRTRVMDMTVSDNATLQNTQDAFKDMIESAYSLFAPMLTTEYVRGAYHPWPLKLRNSTDPLAHLIQGRYGPMEAVRLREQLTTLSELYLDIHRFVAQQQAGYPDASRPMVGEPLRMLCARLALHPRSNTDIIFEVRQRYDRERHLQHAIARINFRLLWNVYLQRAYTERSVTALAQANMDPYTTTLPVGRKVNELAAQRGTLTHERNTLLKERTDNAKHVYRLWKDKGIDIHEGFSPPAAGLSGGRLTVLAEARLGPSAMAVGAPSEGPRGSVQARRLRLPSSQAHPMEEDQDADGRDRASRATSLGHGRGSAQLVDMGSRSASPSLSAGVAGGGSSPRTSLQSAGMSNAQSYLGGMVSAPMTGRV